jgi:hypothetical protein
MGTNRTILLRDVYISYLPHVANEVLLNRVIAPEVCKLYFTYFGISVFYCPNTKRVNFIQQAIRNTGLILTSLASFAMVRWYSGLCWSALQTTQRTLLYRLRSP